MLKSGDCICIVGGIADDQMIQQITYDVISHNADDDTITANVISVDIIPSDGELFATAHKLFETSKNLIEDSKWHEDKMKSGKSVKISSLIQDNYNIVSSRASFTNDINTLCNI